MSRDDDDARTDASADASGDGASPNGSNAPAEPQAAGPLPLPGMAFTPSRKDRLRPAELIGLSAILALFVGLVVLLSTREFILSGVFFGIVFIVSLVVLAMFSLSFKPTAAEAKDLDDQNRHEA